MNTLQKLQHVSTTESLLYIPIRNRVENFVAFTFKEYQFTVADKRQPWILSRLARTPLVHKIFMDFPQTQKYAFFLSKFLIIYE